MGRIRWTAASIGLAMLGAGGYLEWRHEVLVGGSLAVIGLVAWVWGSGSALVEHHGDWHRRAPSDVPARPAIPMARPRRLARRSRG